jgi:subtilase family serine protease
MGRAEKWAKALAACAAGAGLVLAAPTALAAGPQAGAARVGGVSSAEQLKLVLPLKADDAGLEAFAHAVSTPGSPLYGRYESVSTLAGRFGAPPATRARVLGYLRAHGATNLTIDPTGLLAEATMNAVDAERLFQTHLSRFRARGAGFIAPEANVTIPAALSGLVNGVVGLDTQPLVNPPQPQRLPDRPLAHAATTQPSSILPSSGTPAGCGGAVATGGFTPNQYLTAYDYNPLRAAHLAGEGERIALIEIDGFKYSDITTYARCFGLDVPSITTYFGAVGHPLPPGGETTLDLEVLDGIVPDLGELEVFENNSDTAGLLRAVVQPFVTPNAKPQVISISLGLCEADSQFVDGGASIRAAEREFSLMAATGITVLAASGDSGSAACSNNRGPVHQLAVSYPASSPWVTAVGGTNLLLNAANQILGQIVWNDTNQDPGAAGGGGISRLFSRPSYQRGTVSINRRVLPDVSGLADVSPGFATYCTARPDCVNSQSPNPWQTVGGTSASTPLIAGGIALVNQDLHRQGKQFVGQLNPLLYLLGRSSSASSIFYDVTSYGNDVGPYIQGNGQLLGCCSAARGFDPASGWGSLDIADFDRAAVQILPKIPNVSLSIPPNQRPIRRGRIVVMMSCSDRCTAAALAFVSITGGKSFTAQSKPFSLKRNQRTAIPIVFNRVQASRLRTALARHRSIFAEAFGVLLDGGGNVVKTTAARRITLAR